MGTSGMANSLPAAMSACLALAKLQNLHILFVVPCSTACPNATGGLEPPSSKAILPPLGTALFGQPEMHHEASTSLKGNWRRLLDKSKAFKFNTSPQYRNMLENVVGKKQHVNA